MSKNIIVITGSPRNNGNSEILADAFIKGAESSGNNVTKINLNKLKVNSCIGCFYCSSHDGNCVQRDGMDEIYPELRKADMIVLASPIYFCAFTSQMKAFIDRLNVAFAKQFSIKTSALLTVYADTNTSISEPIIATYKSFIQYLNWEDKGIIAVQGMENKGDINDHPSLAQAEEFGASIA